MVPSCRARSVKLIAAELREVKALFQEDFLRKPMILRLETKLEPTGSGRLTYQKPKSHPPQKKNGGDHAKVRKTVLHPQPMGSEGP